MSDISEKEKLVDCALNVLREHFDSVVILASWVDADGTGLVTRRSGNYYARIGMTKEFIDRDKATTSAAKLKDALDGDSED